jgi:hypothetical protein
MIFKFEYTKEDSWPPLAWIAECTASETVIRIRHGSQVEIKGDWFCEAIWDGDFDSGDFDRTDLVFGSGARLRENRVVFVSSGSTVDRLQFLKLGNKVFISNSLAALLAVSGVKVVSTFAGFNRFFRSIQRGLNAYERQLPTQAGILELVYFRNLEWDGQSLHSADKPSPARDFSSFGKYHGFLKSSLASIAGNLRATSRNHGYRMVGALSSGYDSTTATVLAHDAGMKQVFSFRAARGGLKDHGMKVAEALGLEMELLDRRGWQRQVGAEAPFFAATGEGEDVVFCSANELIQGSVLLTGFHGDIVWGKGTKALGPDIVRGDISGLSFTEHRLALGCIHFPVPFMGVRQIADIHVLSNSEELLPWDIPGDYSRPICRRIVEESGVSQDLFGKSKKAATTLFHRGETRLSEKTRVAYFDWLKDNESRWIAAGLKGPRVPSKLLLSLQSHFYVVSQILHGIGRLAPPKVWHWLTRKDTQMQRSLNLRINMMEYLFPWAIEKLGEKYTQSNKVDG